MRWNSEEAYDANQRKTTGGIYATIDVIMMTRSKLNTHIYRQETKKEQMLHKNVFQRVDKFCFKTFDFSFRSGYNFQ